MAVAEIIGAAIGVMMLVVVAYVVLTGTLTAAETVANAQKDLSLQEEVRLRTNIAITSGSNSTTQNWLNFNVTNTGNEVIADFAHTDVFIFTSPSIQHLTYEPSGNNPGTWRKIGIFGSPSLNEREIIHPNQLDPGEMMWVCATYDNTNLINWFQITTGNGVNAQKTYP